VELYGGGCFPAVGTSISRKIGHGGRVCRRQKDPEVQQCQHSSHATREREARGTRNWGVGVMRAAKRSRCFIYSVLNRSKRQESWRWWDGPVGLRHVLFGIPPVGYPYLALACFFTIERIERIMRCGLFRSAHHLACTSIPNNVVLNNVRVPDILGKQKTCKRAVLWGRG